MRNIGRFARLGLAGALAVAGCNLDESRKRIVPDMRCEIKYSPSYDDDQYTFGCSSTEGIRKMFLVDGNQWYTLEPRDKGEFPLGGKKVTRWLGTVPKNVPAGKYDVAIITDGGKLLRRGSYTIKDSLKKSD